MILESKGGQLFFFNLGLGLCAAGIYGLTDLDNAMFNFCRSTVDGSIFNTINQILTVIVLLVVLLLGLILIWWAIHSVRECRKFAEPRPLIDWVKLRKTIIAYTVMIGVLAFLLIFVNKYVDVVTDGRNGRPEIMEVDKDQNIFISCEGEVISFFEKNKYETAPELRGVFGTATVRLMSPDTEKGRLITIKVANDDENKKIWSSIGSTVKFNLRKTTLQSGQAMESTKLHQIKIAESPQ